MAGRPASAAPGFGNWSGGSDSEEEDQYDEDGNLIERAPVETPQEKGLRLIAAAKIGDEDEVRALCLEGADVTVEDPLSKWTALMWASCNGNLDCVEVLLEFQASHMYLDPERIKLHKGSSGHRPQTAPPHMEGKGLARVVLKPAERNTPLHWAAFKGHLAIVWRLMNECPDRTPGLDIHDVDVQGNTALHLAAAGGHVPVALCLLANGADMHAKNYYGNPPLALATQYEVRTALTQLLRQPTFDLDMDDWKVGEPLNLDTAFKKLRRTTIAMRGARVLCCGPWCRSTPEEPNGPPETEPDKPLGVAEICPGKFWSVTSCIQQDVRLAHDREDTRPAMVCKICVEMMKQAEEELRIAIEDKSLEMVVVAYTKAKARGCNVVKLHEGKLMEARLRAENELNAAMDEVASFDDERVWQVPRKKSELERLFNALESAMAKGADTKLLLKAQAFKRTKEAELRLVILYDQCKKIECAGDEHKAKMTQLYRAIDDAKAEGSDVALMQDAEVLKIQLRCELDLTHALLPIIIKERIPDADGRFTVVRVDLKAEAAAAAEAAVGKGSKKKKGKGKGKKKKGPEPPPRDFIYVHHDPAAPNPEEGREYTILLESLTQQDARLAKALAAAGDDVDVFPDLLARAKVEKERLGVDLQKAVAEDEERRRKEEIARAKAAKKAKKKGKGKKKK
jgi:ankyrin repeat protein|eukprot:COSAG02_NODE_1509_length_12226_cov_6.533850_5_plen_681_part_00